MADRVLRLEKADEKGHIDYVEYHREAQNTILRLWCNHNQDGRIVQHQERESFQTSENVETYLKNAKAQYQKQGFKLTFDANKPEKKKAAEAEVSASDLT